MVVERVDESIIEDEVWKYKNIKIDFSTYTFWVDDIGDELTHLNIELLKLFLSSKGKVLTREIIKERIWGEERLINDRNVDFQVWLLRKKLGLSKSELISIRSVGYKLNLRVQ